MRFGQAVGTCFQKFVTFRGRAPRSEYWYFVLFNVLLSIPIRIVGLETPAGGATSVALLFTAIMFLPGVSVTVRRLHDMNHSGWSVLALYVCVGAAIAAILAINAGELDQFGIIVNKVAFSVTVGLSLTAISIGFILVLTQRGTSGPNEYGPDPLGQRESDMIEPIFS